MANPLKNLDDATPGTIKDVGGGSIAVVIGLLIKTVLGFLGVVFLVLIIYGGFIWMTAGGDATKITKAKSIIINSIIGLLVVIASYAITLFVLGGIVGE